MTYDDLATLIRDETVAPEPTHGLDAMVPLRLGRRRVRHRRLVGTAIASAASVLAVIAASAVLTQPLAGPEPSPSADPPALTRIRSLADHHVRAVLERSGPDLGSATVTGRNADHADLPADALSGATEVYIGYGSLDHSYGVNVLRSRESLADPPDWCAPELSREDFTCTSTSLADGTRLAISLYAVRPIGENADGHPTDYEFTVVPKDRLAGVDPTDRFFVRQVTLETRSATVRVIEQVHTPDRADAEAALVVPVDDLRAIVTDPAVLGIAADPGEE